MDLALNDEQRLLQDTVRRLCERKFDLDALRAQEGKTPGYSVELWDSLVELGFAGAAIPADQGGSELGALDLALIYEEFGRSLVPSPHFVSSVLAAGLLQKASNSKHDELPGRIADGSLVLTVAAAEPDRDLTRDGVNLRARRNGEGWVLSGRKHFVAHADVAEKVILLARDDSGGVLGFLLDLDTPGIEVTYQPNLAKEPLFGLAFADIEAPDDALLGTGEDYWETWSSVMTDSAIPLAAQAIGAAERIHEITVAYAKERHAFGRPIGSFQAIAHMLSANLVQIEGCKTLTRYAAWCRDMEREDAGLAAMAKLKACEAFCVASNSAIQVHGGLGYTLEASPQLFFRRAKQWQLLYLDESALEATVAHATLDAAHAGPMPTGGRGAPDGMRLRR